MKKQMVLWTALAVMMLTFTAAGQVRTITLDWNYTGAPPNLTRTTDEHGSLMGEPLPVPTRAGFVFNGWFTAQSGGSVTGKNTARVLVGATGTRFTSNTTIYARWSAPSAIQAASMNDIPAAMKANFDWLRFTRHERERVLFNRENLVFDQIFRGNGTINWAIRWESDRVVTLAERRAIAQMLHEEINKWTRPLIGMPGWPFQEIPVNVVGWAVSSASLIQDRQPNEQIWVNNDHRQPMGIQHANLMASAPDNISRFVNFTRVNAGTYTYPGGVHARFDMYLWCTRGFGGGAGGDWGSRQSETNAINAANAGSSTAFGNTTIITHEVGHAFGLYDFYGGVGTDRPPAVNGVNFGSGDLRTVMHVGSGAPFAALNNYDQWQIRYYWDWVRNATRAQAVGGASSLRIGADRFPTNTVTVVSTGAAGSSGGGTSAAGLTVTISAGTRSGYTFSGWTVSGAGATLANSNSAITTFTMPANNVTVTANWTADGGTITTHTIAFNANGGAGTMTSDNVTQGSNYTIKANTFTRTGHTFAGWNTAANGSGTAHAAGAEINNVRANITLFAQWTPITYTVSFNANGGTGTMTADNVNHGANYTIKANTFTRAGHTFNGWRTAATGGTAHAAGATISNVTGNITLFAQWTPITHSISFNANGGTGTMTADNVNYGANYTIKANTFTRVGHTFSGWRTAASSGTRYADGATINSVVANITLFAQWTPITYTVTFNANGGAGTMTPDNVNHGANYTIKANTFARDGHTFMGWNTAANGSGTTHAAGAQISNVTAAITLFAQWSAHTSVLAPDRVTPGSQPGGGVFEPIVVLAGEFTAGPNPAARSAGMVNIFRTGKRVDDASLTIFDASGNVVNRIKITDNASGDQSRRVVGSWNLTDARGRQVSEGAYLMRGTVTVDGKKERVSMLIGVR